MTMRDSYIRSDDGAVMVEVRPHEYVNEKCVPGVASKPEPKQKRRAA